MKVGFFSPLPPARTGVADYAAALLTALRRHGDVQPGAGPADVALYHIGNNQLHRDIYERALAEPGVIVLHDAVLHHFFLGALDRDGYIAEFQYNYGEWHGGLAAALWRARANAGFDVRYFQYPMLKRIAERSRAVIVHNPAAARMVRAHAPGASIFEIPHLYAPPDMPSAWQSIRLRHSWSIPPSATLFGVFGYLRESKRLFSVLRAFTKVRQGRADAFLLVAGAFVSRDLERAVAPLLGRPGVVRMPYLSEPEFWCAARAVDACINLRYPAAGETSGIAIRLMGAGKAVFVTEGEENSRYPRAGCLRIPAGPGEEEALLRHMLLLVFNKECASEIGLRASDHIAARHQAIPVAEQYWETLCAYRD